MIINRQNYEEHYILYWDDELTASQKQAVENFVKENPDLQQEFKILGETRFTPDNNVQFKEKEFLLNSSFINITNCEEQLLNYIDDELNNNERKEIEKLAAKQPAIQKELVLLQKTKLQPEAEVVFPDKSTLYRREENAESYRHRVISMTWFRIAVAAAIILIAGFVTIRLINTNKGGENTEVANVDPKNSITPIDSAIDLQTNPRPNNQQSDNVKLKENKSPIQPTIENKKQKPVPENKSANTIAAYKPENKNNLPGTKLKTAELSNDQSNSNETFIAKDNNKAVQISESDKTTNVLEYSSVTKSPTPTFANISDEDDLFEKEKDKGGLKGFLRKTTRVFERRTKIQTTTEDNKLLLGAFAVSLK